MAFPLPQTDPSAGPTHSLGETLRGSLLVLLGLLLVIAAIEVPAILLLVVAGALLAHRLYTVSRSVRRDAKNGDDSAENCPTATDPCIDG